MPFLLFLLALQLLNFSSHLLLLFLLLIRPQFDFPELFWTPVLCFLHSWVFQSNSICICSFLARSIICSPSPAPNTFCIFYVLYFLGILALPFLNPCHCYPSFSPSFICNLLYQSYRALVLASTTTFLASFLAVLYFSVFFLFGLVLYFKPSLLYPGHYLYLLTATTYFSLMVRLMLRYGHIFFCIFLNTFSHLFL